MDAVHESVVSPVLDLIGLGSPNKNDTKDAARGASGPPPPPPLFLGMRLDPEDLSIIKLVPMSVADQAGLREGDVIETLSGQRIGVPEDLPKVAPYLVPNRETIVLFRREGIPLQGKFTLTRSDVEMIKERLSPKRADQKRNSVGSNSPGKER